MKVEIKRAALQEAIGRIGGVADGRATPILGNVLAVAKGDGISLTASNLYVTVKTSVVCNVVEEGSTTVPMRRLEQIVSVLPNEDVAISSNATERVEIRSGEVRMCVSGLPSEQFPNVPKAEGDDAVKIKGSALLDLLRKSAYALCRDGTSRTLESVYLEISGNRARCVGTDGKRLGFGDAELSAGASDAGYILNVSAIGSIQKIVSPNDDVEVRLASSRIMLSQHDGRDIVYASLIDGKYPNYRAIMPESCEVSVSFDRQTMLDSLNRASVVSSTGSNYVKMSFSNGAIRIDAEGDNGFTSNDSMPAKFDGKPFVICLNPKYIQDALKSCDDDEIRMQATPNAKSPVVLTAGGDSWYALIMPLIIEA